MGGEVWENVSESGGLDLRPVDKDPLGQTSDERGKIDKSCLFGEIFVDLLV